MKCFTYTLHCNDVLTLAVVWHNKNNSHKIIQDKHFSKWIILNSVPLSFFFTSECSRLIFFCERLYYISECEWNCHSFYFITKKIPIKVIIPHTASCRGYYVIDQSVGIKTSLKTLFRISCYVVVTMNNTLYICKFTRNLDLNFSWENYIVLHVCKRFNMCTWN